MPADILSASLAERLRAHAGAIREIESLIPNALETTHRAESARLLRRTVETLQFVATRLDLDAFESPREAKP